MLFVRFQILIVKSIECAATPISIISPILLFNRKESTSSEDPAQLDVPSFEQPKVQTDDLLNEKLSEFNDNRRGVENIYCEVPKIDVDKIIISHDDIHEDLDEYFRVLEHSADFRSVDERYYSFKKSASKGKSSLTNALLQKEQSIVTPIAGTTRASLDSYLK